MKTALVIGATGLIGRQLVELLLADSRYITVIALARKPLTLKHSKLKNIQFDFDNPDELRVQGDELFCCLGTTIKKAGSQQAFYKVDYEYTLLSAQLAYKNGTKRITLVSSMGADKNARIFYNRTKGAIEEAIAAIGFEATFIVRPSLLLGSRTEFRLGEVIAKTLMKVFDFAIPRKYRAIDAAQVARAMIVLMNSGKRGLNVIESDGLAVL